MKKQKFVRGDVVQIADDLGPTMSHFRGDTQAVVMGSYKDQYGGDNVDSYSVMFLDNGQTCSWYHTHQMTLLRHIGERGIKEIEVQRDKCREQESNLAWIVENWNSFRDEGVPGYSMQALMEMIGIDDPWGPHGEGMTYYMNAMTTFKLLDEVMQTGAIEIVQEKINQIKASYENS
jgi:hypothetical protein